MLWTLTAVAAWVSLAPIVSGTPTRRTSLPIVDLGYERHQAIDFDQKGGFYNFSNIRYGQPPLGDLRFRAPVPVSGKSSKLEDGSVGRICPQALPAWTAISAQFVPAYLAGKPFDFAAAEARLMNATAQAPPVDPRITEDCLFLDVYSPKKVFDRAASNDRQKGGAPVLVWIYGGGYTFGDKLQSGFYNPAGLIKASQVDGSDGIIFVAMNYRLGAFGWLAGPDLQADGTANAGLYDQRLALEWIQKNIYRFGGDKDRVTVLGESAGGGSIMHQITAFAGLKGRAPFAQAIPQSPGFQVIPGTLLQQDIFNAYLALLNVKTIQEARKLPTQALMRANAIQVGMSSYGQFTYGPVVDGIFAPALPGRLLLQGNFDKHVKVMVGHNSDEGLDFSSPAVNSTATFDANLKAVFPDAQPKILQYISNVLYPAVFDGSRPYRNNFERATFVISEETFTCNTFYLDSAYMNKTYAYEFSVGAGLHGSDIPYTFFNAPNPAVLNDKIAVALQEYLTSFAVKGQPSGPGIPSFPLYGPSAQEINLNTTMITQKMDETANDRCRFWQKALYY